MLILFLEEFAFFNSFFLLNYWLNFFFFKKYKILESSISEYDTDLYTSNLVGIPILPRTGGLDDNVPPIHTRRMTRLINEYLHQPDATPFFFFFFF